LIPIEDLKADVKNTFSSVTDNDIDEVLRELNEADFGCENYTLTGDSIHYCFSRSGEIKPTFCIVRLHSIVLLFIIHSSLTIVRYVFYRFKNGYSTTYISWKSI